jgi:hypothetical protein
MGNSKFKPHRRQSIISKVIEQKKTIKDLEADANFLISFRHLDNTQGDSLSTWEQNSKLAHAIEVLAAYCHGPLIQQLSEKFRIYGSFPPPHKTDYKYPKQVPEDANWARIHIDGKQIIAGHVVKNVFYVVFLDPEHRFYISELRNT